MAAPIPFRRPTPKRQRRVRLLTPSERAFVAAARLVLAEQGAPGWPRLLTLLATARGDA
jgi:hypothetical protein